MAVPDYSPCYSVEGRTGDFLVTDTRPHVKEFPRNIPGHIRPVGYRQEGEKLGYGLRQYFGGSWGSVDTFQLLYLFVETMSDQIGVSRD